MRFALKQNSSCERLSKKTKAMTDQQLKMYLTKLKRELLEELKQELAELKDAKAKKFYSQREAAELCGVSATTLRRAIREGKLGAIKNGDPKSNTAVKILASELARYQSEYISGRV